MITTGYLILIAALLIVASLLLYARFVSRAREKSLHHGVAEIPPLEEESGSPGEIDEREAVSDDVAVEEAVEIPEEVIAVETEVAPVSEAAETSTVPVLIQSHSLADTKRSEKEKEEGEYFDELQEAAAGLAMLMRSSPVTDRTTPVVYAPEDLVDGEATEKAESCDPEIEEAPTEVLCKVEDPVREEETADADVEEDSREHGTQLQDEEILAESSDKEEKLARETAETSPDNIVALLGADVSDQIQKIDSGLDALEELVNTIESSLSALDVAASDSDENEDLESAEVSEAA